MREERIESFTDNVIAIIITLMVLGIKLPVLTDGNRLILLRHIGFYGLSFIPIAVIWLNLHNMFLVIEKVDTKTIWTNLFLLFFMSLIPLPTWGIRRAFFLKRNPILGEM